MSLSTLVRSVTAAPATGRAAAAAAASRWCPEIFLRETGASTRVHVLVGRRQFASVNGAVNGSSVDDKGPSSDPAASLAASMQWRRSQIDKLESKFDDKNDGDDDTPDITTDEELQPMWRDMESRVTRRRSLTAAERGPGKVGRRNVRKSDEDVWLASGLYNETEDGKDKKE